MMLCGGIILFACVVVGCVLSLPIAGVVDCSRPCEICRNLEERLVAAKDTKSHLIASLLLYSRATRTTGGWIAYLGAESL
jgi:hypothetical protein